MGSYTQPNLEAILALRPDLVVIQKNPVRLKQRLEALKLRVLELNYEDIGGIHTSITQLGMAVGADSEAAKLIARIRAGLEGIRSKASSLPRRKVLFVVGRTPGTLEGLMAAGGRSYLSEVIRIAGGSNVFEEAPIPYPRISMEEVIARKPEVLIDMGDMSETEGITDAQKRAVVALWRKFAVLPAVQQKRVYAVASDTLVVPGPRVVDAALQFARLIHPEAGF